MIERAIERIPRAKKEEQTVVALQRGVRGVPLYLIYSALGVSTQSHPGDAIAQCFLSQYAVRSLIRPLSSNSLSLT